jgi:hypothetical protein
LCTAKFLSRLLATTYIYIYIYILWKNNTKTGITLIGMVKRLRKEEEEEERNVADKLKVEGLKD